jgi:hypothetical protein
MFQVQQRRVVSTSLVSVFLMLLSLHTATMSGLLREKTLEYDLARSIARLSHNYVLSALMMF